MSGVGGFLLLLCLLAIYFAPACIAAGRDHRNTAAIFVLNLFLGWTFIGWVAALVWSLTWQPEPPIEYMEPSEELPPELAEPPLELSGEPSRTRESLSILRHAAGAK